MNREVLQESPHTEVDWEGPGYYEAHQRYDSRGQFVRWEKCLDQSGAEGTFLHRAEEAN